MAQSTVLHCSTTVLAREICRLLSLSFLFHDLVANLLNVYQRLHLNSRKIGIHHVNVDVNVDAQVQVPSCGNRRDVDSLPSSDGMR